MTQEESYADRLRRSSSESRYDPLRDAVRRVLVAWYALSERERKHLTISMNESMGNLEAMLISVQRGESP
jgi:hypothetical protein